MATKAKTYKWSGAGNLITKKGEIITFPSNGLLTTDDPKLQAELDAELEGKHVSEVTAEEAAVILQENPVVTEEKPVTAATGTVTSDLLAKAQAAASNSK